MLNPASNITVQTLCLNFNRNTNISKHTRAATALAGAVLCAGSSVSENKGAPMRRERSERRGCRAESGAERKDVGAAESAQYNEQRTDPTRR